MSGASLAAGARPSKKHKDGEVRREGDNGLLGGVMGSLRVIELQLVAFIVVFSASGLVPLEDLLFPVFISIYSFFLSSLVFRSYGNGQQPEVFKGNRLFQLYVVSGTAVGLFLPLAYILGGFARGDQQAVRAATPHLFLLSFQILSESLISGMRIFSLPVRALLPILYSTRRIFSLMNWVHATWSGVTRQSFHFHEATDNPFDPRLPEWAWIWFGRGLSIANLVYYSINLFCFLIPMFLPRAFDRYFQDREAHKLEKEHKESHKKGEGNQHLPAVPEHEKAAQPVPGLQGQNAKKAL